MNEIEVKIDELNVLFQHCGRNLLGLQKAIFEIEAITEIFSDNHKADPISEQELFLLNQNVTRQFLNYLETCHSFGDSVVELSKFWHNSDEIPGGEIFEYTKERDSFPDIMMVAEKLRNLLHHNSNTSSLIRYKGRTSAGRKEVKPVEYGTVFIDYLNVLSHPNYLHDKKNDEKKGRLLEKSRKLFECILAKEMKMPHFSRGKKHFQLREKTQNYNEKSVLLCDFVDFHFEDIKNIKCEFESQYRKLTKGPTAFLIN